MKKILSLLTFCLIAICGWATDIVFDASVTTSGNESASEQTISLNGVTLHLTNGILGTSGQYRIYKSETLTVSSETTITKIVFTCTANGTAKYGPGCFAAQEGYSYSGKIGTWEGEANSVAFLAKTNQVRATSIVVTIDDGVTPPPVIIPEISTIAEFIALENNKQFKYTGDLICVQDYSHENNNGNIDRYLYLADATGGIIVYNPDANTPLYETSDIVPGGWTATKTIYKNLPEATATTDFVEKTGNQNIEPITMTIDEANQSTSYGSWVVIKNVLIRQHVTTSLREETGIPTNSSNLYITEDGQNELTVYGGHTSPFNLPTDWETDERYDVVGVLGVYGQTQQILPTGIAKNGEIITGTTEIIETSVKNVLYYNMQGISCEKPFEGVNIVVTEYSDGNKKITKQIYKF